MAGNEALDAEDRYKSVVESTNEYIERFDILETINNVGNDEVFTPRKVVDAMLDALPSEVWHNPDYRWLNPATKTGIFEREIAIRLDDGLKDAIPDVEVRRKHILQNMLFSIGQTKFTSNVARRTLYYCCQANRACDGIKSDDGHYVNGYAIGNGTWFDDPEGNVKTPCSEHVMDKKGKKCIFCGISKDSKYLDANQREKYSYDFIHVKPGFDLQSTLSERFFKGDKEVKFDIIIGNPPYHLSTIDKGTQATPIYQKFAMQAFSLNPKYVSMIMPSKWFAGGMACLDGFREYMRTCGKIRYIVDYANAKDCFPSNSLGGGVNYFLWDRDYNGPCEFTNILADNKNTAIRHLDELPILVRYNKSLSILQKVLEKKEPTIDEITSSLSPFGLPTNYRGCKEKDQDHPVKLYSSNDITYIGVDEVDKDEGCLENYKVIVGKIGAEHALEPDKNGQFRIITNSMKVIAPKEACTHSYFTIGNFDEKAHADNLYKYMKTKFVRFLILQSMTAPNLSKRVLIFVPQQDFSKSYTDEDLYEKYGLTKDEIAYVEGLMKEMD